MRILEDEWEEERNAQKKSQDQQRADEKEAERQELERRAALAEEDRLACLAMAYPVGAICFYFFGARSLSSFGNHYWDRRLNYTNRLCKIVEVLPMKFDHLDWANCLAKILHVDGLLVDNLKYKAVFLPAPPFYNQEGPTLIVEDRHLISLDEVEAQGGLLFAEETNAWGKSDCEGNLIKPNRDFQRKALYSRSHWGGGGGSVGNSGAGSQI